MVWNIHPGSKVAVIAPAGPVAPQPYQTGLDILAGRYQLVHVYRPDDPQSSPLPYLADSDANRAAQLHRALGDPEICAIFCARGGYGCLRLLPQLDSRLLVQRPIPIVGFSDCTVLHAWATCHGVATIHGPVVTQLGRLPAEDLQLLFDLLEGHRLPRLTGMQPVVGGRASGQLWAGNLNLLCHLCGTAFLPDLRGWILILEEVHEPPYRIDRMLTQLRLCGILGQAAGIVFGSLNPGPAQGQKPSAAVQAEAVAIERCQDLGLPVVSGAPIGHGDRNIALPLGYRAMLDADAGTLTIDGPP